MKKGIKTEGETVFDRMDKELGKIEMPAKHTPEAIKEDMARMLASDSKELRALCAARDEARRERNTLKKVNKELLAVLNSILTITAQNGGGPNDAAALHAIEMAAAHVVAKAEGK